MTVQIDTTAENNGVRFVVQGAHPSAPSAGHVLLYYVTGTANPGMFVEDSSGKKYGPFITGSAGGSPSTSEYVTTAADGNLPNAVVIPGFAGSADIAGAGGAGVSNEFDTSSAIFSWDSNPATVDYDTTVKSHIYVRSTGTSVFYGTTAWSPAGAFDLRLGGMQLGLENVGNATSAVGLVVLDATTPGNGVLLEIEINPSTRTCGIVAYTEASGTPTQRGSTWTINATQPVWLRITRDGSNNVSFWFSMSGKPGTYQLIATQSHSFTASFRGFRFNIASAGNGSFVADWMRTDV